MSRFIVINSNNLSSGTVSSGEIELPHLLRGKFKLEYFSCTNNLYNVNAYNNILTAQVNNGVGTTAYTITLTQGFYSLADLASMLDTIFTATTGQIGANQINVTASDSTGKITFTAVAPATFYFTFSGSSYSAQKILGFNADQTSLASSTVSTYPADLFPYKNIYLSIDENKGSSIQGASYFSSSLWIPFGNTFGEPFIYKCKNEVEQFITLNHPNKIRFKFHDDSNNPIEMNNVDWELILSCESTDDF